MTGVSQSIMDFDLLERVHEESKQTDENSWGGSSRRTRALDSDQDAVVSPYAIRNLTEVEIVIEKKLTDEEINRKE